MPLHAIHMPRFPECWESCGACAAGPVFILELSKQVGDWLERDETLLTLETGKVALDIPSPRSGRVIEVHVAAGDAVNEGALLATLSSD